MVCGFPKLDSVTKGGKSEPYRIEKPVLEFRESSKGLAFSYRNVRLEIIILGIWGRTKLIV